jgi:hypothetical protein
MKNVKETLNDIKSELIVCSKETYSNGEKKKYSGYMNTWFTVPYQSLKLTKIKTKKGKEDYTFESFDSVKHIFFFKMKKQYFYHKLSHAEKNLPSYKKVQILIKREHYDHPVYIYRQAFMCANIMVDGELSRLIWSTGDDDSGLDFRFPTKYVDEVKKFIYDNRYSERLYGVLEEYLNERRELGFEFK